MYLSRVLLDEHRRETVRALASPQVLHAAVEASFDNRELQQRLLWRIDRVGGRWYLLLQSSVQPNLSLLVQQFGRMQVDNAGETRDYGPLLHRLANDQRWQFRLRANPVRSSGSEVDGSGRGKVFAHVTMEQQTRWLLVRAESLGFVLAPDEFCVIHSDWNKFYKGSGGRNQVVLRTATFEGTLRIADVERFRQSLICGVGRAKAYGCGLMTIMRLPGITR